MEENVKEYYDFCQKVNFEKKAISRFCERKHLFYDELLSEVFDYMQFTLKKPIYELTVNEATFLFSKDRARFIDKYRILLAEMVNADMRYNKKLWESEPISKIVIEYLFRYFQKVRFNKLHITEKCLIWGLDYEKTCTLVARYALNVCKWTKENVENVFSTLIDKTYDEIPVLLGNILYISSQDEINAILDASIQNYVQVQKDIKSFVSKAYLPNPDAAISNLERKLTNYARYRQTLKASLLEEREQPAKKSLSEEDSNSIKAIHDYMVSLDDTKKKK